MKRFNLILVALLVVGSEAGAQVVPAAKKGAKSLNFTFGGFGGFGLAGTGPGGGIGIAHFLSPVAAARVGLQARRHTRTLSFNGGVGATGVDGKETGMIVGGALDYLKYLRGATSRVRPYIGVGVGVLNVSNSTVPAAATGATPTQVNNAPGGVATPGYANPGTTFDVHANFGAEFFLFNEISLAGEYVLNIASMTSPANQDAITGGATVTTKGNPVTTLFGFGTAGASVRIYF